MFNRARPDKEIEGIIGRNKREDRQAEGKKKKRQERGLAEAKQLPPRSSRAAWKTLQDDSSKRQRRVPDAIERTQIFGS